MKVQRKIKYVLPVILALAFLLSVAQVHATPTYNWIQNSGFEVSGVNQVQGNDFENITDIPRWSLEGSGGMSTETYHSPTHSYSIGYPTGYLTYTFPVAFLGSSVTNFSFWMSLGSGQHLNLQIAYNDSSYSEAIPVYGQDGGMAFHDETSEIDDAKFVSHFILHPANAISYVDDFMFTVTGGSGQSAVTWDSYPWFNIDSFGTDLFSNISTTFGHNSLCSYYTYSVPYGAFLLLQNIDYLDSNTVSEVSLWAWSYVANCRIKFFIVFSDGSIISQTRTMTEIGNWEKLNFWALLLPNRIIEGIVIQVLDGDSSQFTNLDDVSILSTTESGVSVFTWSLSPAPITYTNNSFQAWQRTPYLFTGFIHNATGYINGTGIYTLTSSKGTQTGAIVNGVFSLALSERTGLPDVFLQESLRFNIVTDMSNFTVTVHAGWNYVYVDITPAEPSGIPIELIQFLNTLYVFVVVFAPPIGISLIVRKVKGDAMVGFIAGLALSIVAGIIAKDSEGNPLVPVWGLFIITLVLAYSIFAKVREK